MIYKISKLAIAMFIGYGIAMFNLFIVGFLYDTHFLKLILATVSITNHYFLYATAYNFYVPCSYWMHTLGTSIAYRLNLSQ